MYEKILGSDEKCIFYTNIDERELFNVLHIKIALLIRRRFDYTKDLGNLKLHQKNMGPIRN